MHLPLPANIIVPVRLLLLLFLLFSQGNVMYAQRQGGFRQEPILQPYTMKEGLPSNTLYNILYDNDNLIWISTEKGLVKLDGKTFRVFNTSDGLSANDIYWLYFDRHGNVWPYDFSPDVHYIRNNKVYTYPAAKFNTYWYPSNIYERGDSLIQVRKDNNAFVFIHKGKKVELSKRELFRNMGFPHLDTLQNSLFYTDSYIAILADSGSYYYNIAEKRWSRSAFRSPFKAQTTPITTWRDKIFTYLILDSLYVIFDLRNGHKDSISIHQFKDARSLMIQETYRDYLVINTRSEWIKVDYNMKVLDRLRLPEVFRKKNVGLILKDKPGNIWVTLQDAGLMMMPRVYKDYTRLVFDDGKSYKRLVVTKDARYLFTREGDIQVQDKASGRWLYQFEGMREHYLKHLNVLETPAGILYLSDWKLRIIRKEISEATPVIGEWSGEYNTFKEGIYDSLTNSALLVYHREVYELDLKAPVFKRKLLTNGEYRHITMDSRRNVWLGNGYGKICCYRERKKIREYHFKDNITSMVADHRENIFFLVEGKGILQYNLTTGKFVWLLRRPDIQLVRIIDDGLWLGCTHGVFHFRFDGQKGYRMMHTYPNYRQVLYSELFDLTVYNDTLHLLGDNDLVVAPVQSTPFNDTFFTTSTFVSAVDFNHREAARWSHAGSNFHHRYASSNITFHFASNSISYLGDVHFRYYLEGQDRNWQQTENAFVTYPPLSPGTYKLYLRAVINNTAIQSRISVLTLTILPRWWQTLWFKIMIVTAGALLLSFAVWRLLQRRIQKERAQSEVERQIAELRLKALQSQMNPHFTFNALSAVHSYIKTGKSEAAQELLLQFSHLIRLYLEFSRHKLISLNEEIEALKLYLSIEEKRFSNRFRFVFELGLDAEAFMIPPMLIQPVVENAINHGLYHKKEGKGVLRISVTAPTPGSLHVRISDNGIGRLAAAEMKKKLFPSRATQLIQERIDVLRRSQIAFIDLYTEDLYDASGIPRGTQVDIIINF